MEWIVLLGVSTGMRAMTGIAVLCWFAYLDRLPVEGTWAFWTANVVSVIVFSLFALGEYVGDTLPRTPSRTAPGPAVARIVFGALVGAIMARVWLSPLAGGIVFGAIGAAIGTWGGFYARRFLSRVVGRDLPVALGESAFAVLLAVYALRHYLRLMHHLPAVYVGATAPHVIR